MGYVGEESFTVAEVPPRCKVLLALFLKICTHAESHVRSQQAKLKAYHITLRDGKGLQGSLLPFITSLAGEGTLAP